MDTEVGVVRELLAGGGNAAAIAAVWLAWKAYTGILELLKDLRNGQEQIKLAIVRKDPEAATVFKETKRQLAE